MAAGGKCKYLLYVASADALTNRQRRAANIVHVLCQSEEGDHVELLIELTGAGSTSSL